VAFSSQLFEIRIDPLDHPTVASELGKTGRIQRDLAEP
jgi:hypothetical protein